MLELRPAWLAVVRQILAAHVPDADVFAFGSRVQGTSHDGSDLDLVICHPENLDSPSPNLSELKHAFSDSNLPILVDILDWARLPESFRKEILRGGTVQVQSRRDSALGP